MAVSKEKLPRLHDNGETKNKRGRLEISPTRLARIKKRVTYHLWRHSCATHLLQNKANLRHVQEILGHRSLATTERYLHPTGLEDLNIFPRGEEIQKNADKTELSSDKFTVGGHGAPDSMIDSNKNEISVQKLGDMIKNNPKYDPSKPVELDSCKTGRDMHDGTSPFAQRLANYLGSKVIAPTKDIFIDADGKVTHDKDGYFRIFIPEKKN